MNSSPGTYKLVVSSSSSSLSLAVQLLNLISIEFLYLTILFLPRAEITMATEGYGDGHGYTASGRLQDYVFGSVSGLNLLSYGKVNKGCWNAGPDQGTARGKLLAGYTQAGFFRYGVLLLPRSLFRRAINSLQWQISV